MRIGVLGLGLMGEPVAGRLLAAGHEVVVVRHRNRDPIERLVAKGARELSSLASAAAEIELALMLLPTSNEVEAVLFAPDGIVAASRPGLLAVDMGTCYPLDTRRIAGALPCAGWPFYRCARHRRRRGCPSRNAHRHGGRRSSAPRRNPPRALELQPSRLSLWRDRVRPQRKVDPEHDRLD